MERQKIFWVVLSVSVFVVVVLVVGAFLLRPRPAFSTEAPVAVTPLSDQGSQVYEYQVPAGTAGASGTTATGEAGGGVAGASGAAGSPGASGSSGNTETFHFYIGEGQGNAGSAPPTPAPTVTAPAAAGEAVTPPTQSPGTASQVAAAGRATPAPRSAPTARPTLETAAAALAASKPAPRGPEYWIQAGSYKSQTKAEDLAALLGDKGLAGRVFSYAVQGATWYRVRVGPYTSKGEADKFLAEVKKLQGLETSYVSQVGRPSIN